MCINFCFRLSNFAGGKRVPICGGGGTNGKFEEKKRHILKELLKSLEKTYENQRKVIKLIGSIKWLLLLLLNFWLHNHLFRVSRPYPELLSFTIFFVHSWWNNWLCPPDLARHILESCSRSRESSIRVTPAAALRGLEGGGRRSRRHPV